MARSSALLAAAVLLARHGCGGWHAPSRPHTQRLLEEVQATQECASSSDTCPPPSSAADSVRGARGCAIDRVPWGSLSTAQFAEQHVAAGRPIVFTGAAEAFVLKPQEW